MGWCEKPNRQVFTTMEKVDKKKPNRGHHVHDGVGRVSDLLRDWT